MYYTQNTTLCRVILVLLPIFLISNAVVPQERLTLLMAQEHQGQNDTSATNIENLRKSIIPQAEEVNEANSQLIKICTDSPNARCDDTMIIIYNDCEAYPAYVATYIPTCGDSRLFSYLVVRELLSDIS